jgi:hypothetical protein
MYAIFLLLAISATAVLDAPGIDVSALGEASFGARNGRVSGLMLSPAPPDNQYVVWAPPARPIAKLTCIDPNCGREFGRQCELQRHYNLTGHGQSTQKQGKKKKRRIPVSFTTKRNTLLKIDALERSGVQCALSQCSHETGISLPQLSKWQRERVKIFTKARTPGLATKSKDRPSVGAYPHLESILYSRFLWRRKYLRLRTSTDWEKRNMLAIFNTHYQSLGEIPPQFLASDGWCTNFNRRWDITYQCRTNKHKRTVMERLPQIARFHQWLIYGVQRSAPQRCPIYGRYPPHLMYHMDQVPLPFAPTSKRTLNMRGEACEVKLPGGSSTEKRFCTLQVCICAQADQQNVKLVIIFRGQGKRVKPGTVEYEHYASLDNVDIMWQRKAWADERVSMDWLMSFREQTLDQGEVLLGMDGHGAQTTQMCMDFMEMTGIQVAKTPANCTDCVSPVDRNVGQAIKLKIAKRYEAAYEANTASWDLPKKEGGLGDSRKRMLVATWASEAWDEFCRENQHCIRSAFVETGFLIAKDGSENMKVCLWKKRRVAGNPNLNFANVAPDGSSYNFDSNYEADNNIENDDIDRFDRY